MAFFWGDARATLAVEDLGPDEHPSAGLLSALAARAAGACALVLALALAGALISYDPDDPSLMMATGRAAGNWLGAPGALIADALIQGLGLAAWSVAALIGVWGWRLATARGDERIWARLLVMLPAIGAVSIFAALNAPWDGWPIGAGLGGVLGDRAATVLLLSLPVPPADAALQLMLGMGAAAAVLMAAALGMTWAETRMIGRGLAGLALSVAMPLWRMVRRTPDMASAAMAGREGPRAPRSETMAPAEPVRGRARMVVEDDPDAEFVIEYDDEDADRAPGRAAGLIGFAGRSVSGLGARLAGFGRAGGADDAEPAAQPAARMEPRMAEPTLRTLAGPEGAAGAAGAGVGAAIRGLDMGTADDDDALDRPAVEIDDDPAAAPPVTAPKRAPMRRSRRAEAEAQPSLFDAGLGNDPYEPPSLSLLTRPVDIQVPQASQAALSENARMLETVLDDYGVRGEIVAVKPGPVVTLYELEPAPGLKASRVIGLADDIARSMSALSARIATVPGRSVIGIELPNQSRTTVFLRETLEGPAYGDARFPLALALGKDIGGEPVVQNLAKMPHLLVAGTTGSGKSVAINTMILSLLYRLSPKQCRLIMVDPKMLELSVYDGIPHLLAPVVTDPKKAVVALKWVVAEMEERYRRMSKLGVRNIDGYNARCRDAIAKGENFTRVIQTGFDEDTGEPVYEHQEFEPEEMPLIVVIVDEMADLMMVAGKEIEACIQRLAQMARASGIHLIMATQRPSVDVITGTIKANFPTRISFQVTSKIDSRTILGEQGAEQLLGQGDMLFMGGGGRIRRVHGPFVSDEEVEEVVRHLKALGAPSYVDAVTEGGDEETQSLVDEKLGLAGAGDGDDVLYDKAVAIVARDRKCSTSYIQRKLAIGYNKAARLVEQMEAQGVVSPANAVGKREIMVSER
ncbi:MAG: DNA translocase FtsK 4TM domain-containing protein [Pseudomonadota bacterium]